MPDFKEPTITRTAGIVVDSTDFNDRGYLCITDTSGDIHKIGPKRATKLLDIFQPGAAITLKYAVYKDQEYITDAEPAITDAEPAKDNLPTPPKPSTVKVPAGAVIKFLEGEKPQEQIKPPITQHAEGQRIGMTIKEIGDMIRANKLRILFGGEIGNDLVKWWRGEILGATRIPFDGSKLPKFDVKRADLPLEWDANYSNEPDKLERRMNK